MDFHSLGSRAPAGPLDRLIVLLQREIDLRFQLMEIKQSWIGGLSRMALLKSSRAFSNCPSPE